MSTFWHWWIIIISLGMIGFCYWLLQSTKSMKVDAKGPVGEDGVPTTGHVYDGIEEYDNPLPRWWLYLFYITIVFALGYLALYPGLGRWEGLLGWSQNTQWLFDKEAAEDRLEVYYSRFDNREIAELATDPEALSVGRSLFLNNCMVCHGSDGRGALGYPNLTDADWLYGGDPDTLTTTLVDGREGNMPTMIGAVGGEEGARDVAHYVLSLSNNPASDPVAAARGEAKFPVCAACHGADAKGNQAIGAPNLTDNIWLYGSRVEDIMTTIRDGRYGVMPAQGKMLNEDQIRMLVTYVTHLSAASRTDD